MVMVVRVWLVMWGLILCWVVFILGNLGMGYFG